MRRALLDSIGDGQADPARYRGEDNDRKPVTDTTFSDLFAEATSGT